MDNKKKVAAAVAATIAASGAAVDASFDNPADLLQADAQAQPQIQYVDLAHDQDGAADEERQKAGAEKSGPVREWILHLPLAVRAVFILPIWCVGHLLVMGGELLLAGLSPIMHWALGFFLLALVIAGAFTAAAKAMFPDLPLGKILNRHTIKGILIAAGAAWLADLLLGVFWDGYGQFKSLFLACFTLAAIACVVIWFARREQGRRKAAAAAAEAARAQMEEEADLVYTSLGQTFTVRRQ